MKKYIFVLTLLFALFNLLQAQIKPIERMEPAFWWIGLVDNSLQIMVYGDQIATAEITIDSDKVKVKSFETTTNSNYVFINLEVNPKANPGSFDINFKKGKKVITKSYELKARTANAALKPQISGADAIYLITPDRFANGNVANDKVESLTEGLNRSESFGRHGGDIQGVINNLDYIKDLGMTALWLNPVKENNQEAFTYHGYAISDFYKIDERFGSNELYKNLAEELHKRDMKLIMDLVFNQCGSDHWWMSDLPTEDWINNWDIGRSVFQNSLVSDPNASSYELKKQVKGYFDVNMPDLNYENPILAKYMIQNAIWWIEYASLDGLRIDTYPYPDKDFMAVWRNAMEREYPGMFVVAEIWVHDVAYAAYWNAPGKFNDGYESGINSITDFPLYYGMIEGLKKDGDVWKTYHTLAKDFLYGSPERNVVFFDNHDISRSFAELGHDMDQYKLGVAFTLTTRGILQWYYGSEIAMSESENHGVIREDMPGGWPGDSVNVFASKNLNKQQTEALEFTKKLLNWRKNSQAIDRGKLVHFLPEDNCYVYFRVSDNETIMVILNNSNDQKEFKLDRYHEILKDFSIGKNVIDNTEFNLDSSISIKARTPYVLKLN